MILRKLFSQTLWSLLFFSFGLPVFGQPTITSVNDSPISGYSSTITVTVSDANGYQSIGLVDLLINNYLDGASACYVAFVPSSASAGYIYLVNDAGDPNGDFAPNSPFGVPGTGSASNSQCTISGSGVFASASGNTLTLTLSIAFTAAFDGGKVLYTAAQDTSGGDSGWQSANTFTVGTPLFSIVPPSGIGMSQTFTFNVADANGWQDGNVVDVLMNSDYIDGVTACYFAYLPQAQVIYLVDNAGDAGGPFAGTISFSGSGTSGTGSGTASKTVNAR